MFSRFHRLSPTKRSIHNFPVARKGGGECGSSYGRLESPLMRRVRPHARHGAMEHYAKSSPARDGFAPPSPRLPPRGLHGTSWAETPPTLDGGVAVKNHGPRLVNAFGYQDSPKRALESPLEMPLGEPTGVNHLSTGELAALFKTNVELKIMEVGECLSEKRGRERREKEREERKGEEGVASYDTSVQGHTKRREGEGFPATTKASRDTQARRRERKGRRKEREGKEKEEDRCSQLRTSVQTHTSERGEPKYYIQEHPKRTKKGERGGEGRRKGAKVATDSNESKRTWAATATYAVP